ncbi:MAG: TMEM43 family protein [Akkermansiaceae bacterium]
MAARKKKKGNGIIFGLVLMGISIGAIWKNEHRFDYYKAAKATVAVEAVDALNPGALFSYTGEMDQDLTLKGEYVQSFEGFLTVKRSAEIFAWDRDEDDDGVTWSKEWMSNLQSNDRNKGLEKKFRSTTLAPPEYQISDLPVQSADIQFVDANESIAPAELSLSEKGANQGLVVQNAYFYLAKGKSDKLGDERISYSGIPVPMEATYFGKWQNGNGVAHKAEVKKGFISNIIQDKGILHHLVAGPREVALISVKKHLARLKMIVRIIGLVACTIGGGILFSSLTRVLVFIPIVGPFINQVTGWIGMLFGFLIGLITLVFAFLTSQPLILGALAVVIVAGVLLIVRNATRKRKGLQNEVAASLGHAPSSGEMAELEYIQLWQLAALNGEINQEEQRCLDKWTRRNGWSQEKIAALSLRARQETTNSDGRVKLKTLIRYSLADGRIDRNELKTLQTVVGWIGLGKKDLRILMKQVQSGFG